MGEFTYETRNISKNLETYEWDNIWWEQTANTTSKRILYIGDSIYCGTRHCITALSNSEIVCDGFGTSKGIDNPHLKASIELCMKQSKCDMLLFNNGLHGWHLSNEEYEKYYEELLLFLLKAKKPIYILLTTDDLANPSRIETIVARNKIAASLAQKYNLPVIDLYTVAINSPEHHIPDGVHFHAEGYNLLAKCILESIG